MLLYQPDLQVKKLGNRYPSVPVSFNLQKESFAATDSGYSEIMPLKVGLGQPRSFLTENSVQAVSCSFNHQLDCIAAELASRHLRSEQADQRRVASKRASPTLLTKVLLRNFSFNAHNTSLKINGSKDDFGSLLQIPHLDPNAPSVPQEIKIQAVSRRQRIMSHRIGCSRVDPTVSANTLKVMAFTYQTPQGLFNAMD
ncbi:hypothetical protein BDV3_004920 [Batrachochytrium dendrobatidis]|nr:hypothetical protein O5D80_006900 [Batrachochytrium dendrobatidis]KAK5670906.1 hypothetical protein QVD99_002676 [Batrachochytrium dendrobatidis]OAJ40417.1 hypothetical protein BDEG_24156 [Batrachochytrium dendrobatidis JEL423]